MCTPRCDIGVRTGERVTADLLVGGGVRGRMGEEEEPGSGGEGKCGGNNNLVALDESDGPALGEDGYVEDVANTRVKSS